MKFEGPSNNGMQPTFPRAAFKSAGLFSIVLGRQSRLVFNERVNAADAHRWTAGEQLQQSRLGR